MTIKYIAALLLAVAAGSSFATDTNKQQDRTPPPVAEQEIGIKTVDYPAAAVKPTTGRTRAEVHAEAVEAAKSWKSPLVEQLDLLK